jgi:hypothetical protein
MTKSEIEALKKRVEAASALDGDLLARTADAVRRAFPKAPAALEATLTSVEQVLHLVDTVLPTWTIQLTGKAMEPDGHWRCSLRETRGSDEDETIGLGTGAAVGVALVAALLHVAAQKATH